MLSFARQSICSGCPNTMPAFYLWRICNEMGKNSCNPGNRVDLSLTLGG